MAFRTVKEFMRLEASGGIVLLVAALVAMSCVNSPISQYYYDFFHTVFSMRIGHWIYSNSVQLWINNALMTVFFLLVGLEIKREMIEGELNTFKKAVLPAIAAIGGIVVPVLFFLALTTHDSQVTRGWGIPTATDVPFSLAVLAVLRSRIPVTLKIFLTALAIFDDIGAIFVIALFYTDTFHLLMILFALLTIGLLFYLNKRNVMRLSPYLLLGVLLWAFVHKSGIHPSLSGIILAMAIPLRNSKNPIDSPLRYLIQKLHVFVIFIILPLFALANADIRFSDFNVTFLTHPLTLGIAAGLFFGKQIGIWLASFIAVRLKIATLPRGMSLMNLWGMGIVGGVGFTMSIFIGHLAFDGNNLHLELMRLGVVIGSLASAIFGIIILWFFGHKGSEELEALKGFV